MRPIHSLRERALVCLTTFGAFCAGTPSAVSQPMKHMNNALRLTLCLCLLGGCNVDLYRTVEDARLTGSLQVEAESGDVVQILDGELANGALDQNQLMCATPSLLREGVPLLVLLAGPDLDLELSVHLASGSSVDADEADDGRSRRLFGAISYQGRNLEGFREQPCSFRLTSYDEGGAGAIRMDCSFRDADTGERFTLNGDVEMQGCFRDRELIFESEDPIDGIFNAASGPDNELLRALTSVGILAPVLVGAVFFVGGHGFH